MSLLRNDEGQWKASCLIQKILSQAFTSTNFLLIFPPQEEEEGWKENSSDDFES